MTFDRSYTLSKEFEYNLIEVISKYNLKILHIKNISVDEVSLGAVKSIQLFSQKNLSKLGIMNYNKTSALGYSIGNQYTKQVYNCKVLFSGDHVIGIYILCDLEIGLNSINKFKSEMNYKFSNYKINWKYL